MPNLIFLLYRRARHGGHPECLRAGVIPPAVRRQTPRHRSLHVVCGLPRPGRIAILVAMSADQSDHLSDSERFDALVREHYLRLKNFVARYTESADDADDIVQDLFVRVWERA